MSVTVYMKAAPEINTAAIAPGKVGREYEVQIDASGDIPIYVSADGLPAGLEVRELWHQLPNSVEENPGLSIYSPPLIRYYVPSILIAGIPEESGSFDIVVSVRNEWGDSADRTLTLYIAPPDDPIAIDIAHFPDEVFRDYILYNYDTNHDGMLGWQEIAAIQTFPADFSYTADPENGLVMTSPNTLAITDLTGIEYFTNLKTVCLPKGVKNVDLTGNTSLEALFLNEAEVESLDISGDTELRIIGGWISADIPQPFYCPPPRQWPETFKYIEYLELPPGDITQLDLEDNTELKRAEIPPQNASGDLISDDSAEYPYSFDFRTIISEDNLPKIDRDSIQVFDENGGTMQYVFDNYVLRFRTPPHVIKYKYDTGALNLKMDVTITIKQEYLVVRPEFTFASDDVPEGREGETYSFDITVRGTGPFRWVITDGRLPDGLTLDENTGRISGIPTGQGNFRVMITVSNSQYSVSITIIIIIRGRTGGGIEFTVSPDDVPEGREGESYSFDITVRGTGPFRWVITDGRLPGGLTLDENTGRISGIPTAHNSFRVTITVSDSSGYSVSITITIIIREAVAKPSITVTTPNTGTVGQSYTFRITVSGTAPFTWSVTSGSLPPGLILNQDGTITGTPTRADTFTFTITVSNSAGSVSQEFTIIIRAGGGSSSGLSITTASITSGTINVSYTFTLIASGSTSITWRIISGSLPAGLTLSTAGIISGTPTERGTFRFTVQASGGGRTVTREFTITINGEDTADITAPRITTSSLISGVLRISYSFRLTASGTSPVTWSVSKGTLPPGLSLMASGEIRGTPTAAGTFTFTVSVRNTAGEDSREFTLIIRASGDVSPDIGDGVKPDITAMFILKDGYIGIWYSVNLYAEGTRAISWRITEGRLPAGLTLNANGTISGTPTTAGEYVFTVEAVNNWGTDLAVFVINVYADSGQSTTGQTGGGTGTGIIYEYRRTITSLTEYELGFLPGDIYIIACVLPRFRVLTAGTYRFTVNIYETVQTGLTLVWFPFAESGSGGGTAAFMDYRGSQITVVPNNRRVIVSVYLDAGTYAPVIAALRPDEPESQDEKPSSGGGGGGGGCSSGFGVMMLAVLAGMPLCLRKENQPL